MSPGLILIGIFAFGAFGGGVAALVSSLSHRVAAQRITARLETIADAVQKLDANVADVKKQTDGMTKALVALTDKEAHARGMKDQAAEDGTEEKETP